MINSVAALALLASPAAAQRIGVGVGVGVGGAGAGGTAAPALSALSGTADANAATSTVVASPTSTLSGCTWSLAAQSNFAQSSSTGVVTKAASNVSAGSYTPATTCSRTANNQTISVSAALALTITGTVANILQRAPGTSDDTARGFVVGDSWLNTSTGSVYQATAVTAGAATWAQQTALPLDAYNPAGTAAYSLRTRLKLSYAGPLARILRVSDSTTMDVAQDANGRANTAAVISWMNAVTSTYRIVTAYDQSGNALDATQATVANAPTITATEITNHGITLTNGWLDLPAGVSHASNAHTAFALTKTFLPYIQNDGVYQVGTSTSDGSNPLARGVGGYLMGGTVGNQAGVRQPTFNRSSVLSFWTNGSSRRQAVNDDVASGGSGYNTSTVVTGGAWGKNIWGNLAAGARHQALILYPAALTTAQEAAVRAGFYLAEQFAPQYNRTLLYVGDSITQGVQSSNQLTKSRPALYADNATIPTRVINMGVSGRTMATINGTSPRADVTGVFHAGRGNVLMLFACTNDIAGAASGSISGAGTTCYNTLKSYIQAKQAEGWKVVTGTMMTRTEFQTGTDAAARNAERVAFNNSVKSEMPGLGVPVVDFDALQAAGNVPFADGVHPTDAGYQAMYQAEKPVIDQAFSDTGYAAIDAGRGVMVAANDNHSTVLRKAA